MRHLFAPLAEQDIEAIGDYIAQDNPNRAIIFTTELLNQCSKISASPKAFRLRPELGTNVRSCAYGNYVIFFQDDNREILIVRILHGSIDIEAQFSKEQQ